MHIHAELMCTCDMTDSCVYYADSYVVSRMHTCVAYIFSYMCALTQDRCVRVPWLVHVYRTHSYVVSRIDTCVAYTHSDMFAIIQDWSVCVKSLIHMFIMRIHTWYHEFICVRWLDKTPTCGWCDALIHTWYHEYICARWLDKTPACVWCHALVGVTWLIHMFNMLIHTWYHEFICVRWLDKTCTCVLCDALIGVTWHFEMCSLMHSHASLDAFIQGGDVPYGVATISRLLTIIGLFCRIWSLL